MAISGLPMVLHHLSVGGDVVATAVREELAKRLTDPEWIAAVLSQMRANRSCFII